MSEAPKRYIGKITKVDKEGGWGFISSKQVRFTRIFFHFTRLAHDTVHFNELEKGDEVEFEIYEHPEKGVQAHKIHALEPEDNTNGQEQRKRKEPKK